MAEYYITINEAAYLMGFSVDTVQKMIDKGELLVNRGTNPLLIHDSEIGRFQHPWKHIFRLDQRMNALQEVIEIIKKRDLHGSFAGHRDGLNVQVNDLQYELRELEERVQSLTMQNNMLNDKIGRIMEKFPALVETVDALLAKQKKPLSSTRKK